MQYRVSDLETDNGHLEKDKAAIEEENKVSEWLEE